MTSHGSSEETLTDYLKYSRQRYCPPGVDSAVQHLQAWTSLTDWRTRGQTCVVHAHRLFSANGSRESCTDRCTVYHECKTDEVPRSHSVYNSCAISVQEDKR